MLLSKLARVPAKLPILAAALCLSTAGSLPAETIVSSLSNTSSIVNFGIGAWAGSSFMTDTQSWTLTSATVTLELGAQNSSSANVRLMSDIAGRPGVTLADLGTRTVATGAQLYTFSNSTAVTLAPSSAYWIVVGNVGTNGGLNVAVSMQGEAFTNTGVPGASMTNSISVGASVSATPPVQWGASTPGIALLFAVEGNRQQSGSAPSLSIESLDNQRVYVSWPTNFTGYTLEAATNVVGSAWTSIGTSPTIQSNRFSHVLEGAAARQFFRLRRP